MPVRRFVPALDLSAPFKHNEDDSRKDFVLLGRQDKFSSNIPYRLRPAPKLTTITESSLPSGERSPPPTPRERTKAKVGPPPMVIFDTGAPSKARVVPPPTIIFDTGAPSKSRSDLNVKNDSEAVTERKGRSLSFNEASRETATRASVPDVSTVETKRAKSESLAASNEQRSGVRIAQSSVKNSYPMVMPSGSAPVRHEPLRIARNIWPVRSEYTVQFADTSAQHSSPLLRAEQIVRRYDSSNILPLMSAMVHKSTEYGERFNRNIASSYAEFVPRQPTTFTPDRHQAKLMRHARNPQALHFPHGPYKRHQSEYRSSFSTPALNKLVDSRPMEIIDQEFEKKKFEYEQLLPNTARDFYSEHRLTQKRKYHRTPRSVCDDKESHGAEIIHGDSKRAVNQDLDWFNAVLALRLEAQRNKQRGTQTNFALSHLFQLKSKQAELWNTVGNSSSLSALDLEQGKYNGRHHLSRTTPVVDGALLSRRHDDDDTASVSTLVASDIQAASVYSYQSSNYEDPTYNQRNDNDVESCVSSLSSISSRASEVLERAKARRNCWDTDAA